MSNRYFESLDKWIVRDDLDNVDDHETEGERWFFEKFGGCGCGDPQATIRLIRDYLNACSESDGSFNWPNWEEFIKDHKKGFFYAFAYHIDHLGLTEHGTTIMYPWITAEGERVRDMKWPEDSDE